MQYTNVRGVLYGRRNRLKEVLAGKAAANEGEGSAWVRRRAEVEAPGASATVPGELRATD